MSSAVGGSRRSFYYTMNYDDDADLDDAAIVSPNRNQISCECEFESKSGKPYLRSCVC